MRTFHTQTYKGVPLVVVKYALGGKASIAVGIGPVQITVNDSEEIQHNNLAKSLAKLGVKFNRAIVIQRDIYDRLFSYERGDDEHDAEVDHNLSFARGGSDVPF
jgi:hypothetical protein